MSVARLQVRRHDRGGQQPVDGRHEPLGAGAHAEGAAQPRGPHRHLLARQSGIARPGPKPRCALPHPRTECPTPGKDYSPK